MGYVAKTIFHEVTFMDESPVHTTFKELRKAPHDLKMKTFLYHYNCGDTKMFSF